jgi:hypothetical protein
MRKYIENYGYFFAAILFSITAIIDFVGKQTSLGFLHLCLAFAFMTLGFGKKKKHK